MSLTVSQELEQQLAKLAGASGRDPQELADEAVREFIDRETKMAALRAAIDEGDASGIAEDSSMEGVLAEMRAKRGR